jgi:hypothetical protein
MQRAALIFWVHFLFATICHALLPIMLIGVIRVLINSELDFWVCGLILGCTIFSAQFLINHLFNPHSFCVLNDLENYYREKAGLKNVGSFLPRYYEKLDDIIQIVIFWKK